MEASKKGTWLKRVLGYKPKCKKFRRRKRRHGGRNKTSGVNDSSESELSSNPPPPNSEIGSEVIPPETLDNKGTSDSKEDLSTTVDLSSAGDEKMLKDLSTEGHQQLVILLEPSCPLGNDYRMLASRMGYNYEYIRYLGSLHEPVRTLIMKYMYEKEGRTISELTSLLEKIDRPDVVKVLQKYQEITPTPREIEERLQRCSLSKIEEQKTSRPIYDAFVCCAKEDWGFADKLVKKLESAPYNLRLCLTERDFLPGGSRFNTTAVAIEKRCRKFVLVLSRHYDYSELCRFESHVAMSVSTGTKGNILIIPVLIDEDYRKNIPLFIYYLFYLDYIRLEEKLFWNKLAKSLGWKPSNEDWFR